MGSDIMRVSDSVVDNVIARPELGDVIRYNGFVIAECFDVLKSGNKRLKWRDEGNNSITAQHLQYTRDYVWGLGGSAPDTTKFVRLFVSNYVPANPAAITGDASTWTGLSFTEASMAGYTGQAYTAAANGSYGVSNSAAKATFTMPGSGGPWNVYGAFLHQDASGGAASAIMYFVRQFTTAPRALANSDVLEVTYNVTYA